MAAKTYRYIHLGLITSGCLILLNTTAHIYSGPVFRLGSGASVTPRLPIHLTSPTTTSSHLRGQSASSAVNAVSALTANEPNGYPQRKATSTLTANEPNGYSPPKGRLLLRHSRKTQSEIPDPRRRSTEPVNSSWNPILWIICTFAPAAALYSITCMMMHGRTGGTLPVLTNTNYNYRQPPSWNPENERQYSMRAWLYDLRIWTMLTDLTEQQQAAAIVMRLEGSAREAARSIPIEELQLGGDVAGEHLGPVSYLVT